MIRRPPRSTQSRSSAASDVYKRQICGLEMIHSQGRDRYSLTAALLHYRIGHGNLSCQFQPDKERDGWCLCMCVARDLHPNDSYQGLRMRVNKNVPIRTAHCLSLIHISEPTRLGMISYA